MRIEKFYKLRDKGKKTPMYRLVSEYGEYMTVGKDKYGFPLLCSGSLEKVERVRLELLAFYAGVNYDKVEHYGKKLGKRKKAGRTTAQKKHSVIQRNLREFRRIGGNYNKFSCISIDGMKERTKK